MALESPEIWRNGRRVRNEARGAGEILCRSSGRVPGERGAILDERKGMSDLCREHKEAAKVCRYCGHDFEFFERDGPLLPQIPKKKKRSIGKIFLIVILVIVGMNIANEYAKIDESGGVSSFDAGQEATNRASRAVAVNPPPIRPAARAVTAFGLAQAYEENEVAAQKEYGGQRLAVTGRVSRIILNFSDDPVVVFEGTSAFNTVWATFSKEYSDAASALSKGQVATITCAKISQKLSTPMLNKCSM